MIAKQYPEVLFVRNRKKAVAYYLQVIEGVNFPLSQEDFFKVPSIESISRELRKVRENWGVTDGNAVNLEQEWRQFYSEPYKRL